jgi:hypothetical protein
MSQLINSRYQPSGPEIAAKSRPTNTMSLTHPSCTIQRSHLSELNRATLQYFLAGLLQ